MDKSVRQHPKEAQKPLTRYEQQKERLLRKVLARVAEAEKIAKSEKRKASICEVSVSDFRNFPDRQTVLLVVSVI
jgi:hypothetical protein